MRCGRLYRIHTRLYSYSKRTAPITGETIDSISIEFKIGLCCALVYQTELGSCCAHNHNFGKNNIGWNCRLYSNSMRASSWHLHAAAMIKSYWQHPIRLCAANLLIASCYLLRRAWQNATQPIIALQSNCLLYCLSANTMVSYCTSNTYSLHYTRLDTNYHI